MKYVLIGCGRVSRHHIKAALANGLSVAALCDRVPEKAAKLAESFGLNIPVYDDYRKMITEISPDIASIATDSGCHAEIEIFCAENGVNFLTEKPMAMSMQEADAIIAAAEKSGVIAGVCHQNRFNIAVQELKTAIDRGRFGKISHASVNIRWHRGYDYYSQDAWRGKWQSDGGTLMNQCIHGMDLLRWLMGDEIESVYGITRNALHPYIEAEDVGVAVVKFKNGAVATVEGTVNAVCDLEETLCVFGENGTVRLGGDAANTVDVWKFTDEEAADSDRRFIEEKAENVYGNGHTSLYLDFINAVKEKRPPYVDLYAGRRAVEFVLAVYKSRKIGEKVMLPLGDFASVDMAGMFDD